MNLCVKFLWFLGGKFCFGMVTNKFEIIVLQFKFCNPNWTELLYFLGTFPRQAEILIWSFPGKVCSTIWELIKNPKIHRFKKRIQKSSWIAVGFFRRWTKINLRVEVNKNDKPNPAKNAWFCKCKSSKIFNFWSKKAFYILIFFSFT